MHGAETWTVRKEEHKKLYNFLIVMLERLEVSWIDCVKNEVLPQPQGEEHSTYNKVRRADYMGNILRRKCLLQHVTEES